jgi:hypothetical protein
MSVQIGELVKVATEGGKPGIVREIATDGMIGVALVNEKGRVDLWQPSQVTIITPSEAARLALKFVRR